MTTNHQVLLEIYEGSGQTPFRVECFEGLPKKNNHVFVIRIPLTNDLVLRGVIKPRKMRRFTDGTIANHSSRQTDWDYLAKNKRLTWQPLPSVAGHELGRFFIDGKAVNEAEDGDMGMDIPPPQIGGRDEINR